MAFDVLLIDADSIAVAISAVGQTNLLFPGAEPVVHATGENLLDAADHRLAKIRKELGSPDAHVVVCFSCPSAEGWRRKVYPPYKTNRTAPRPVLLPEARAALSAAADETFSRPELEADDILGILATHPKRYKGKKVCMVSIDKDLLQVPGVLWSPLWSTGRPIETSAMGGEMTHMLQTLAGDTVDGYPGCKGVGLRRAEPIIQGGWPAVRQAFLDRGHSEEFFLQMARVSKILQYPDYDFKRKEVKLWNMPE